jgi:beta-phosphoglucomutase-like phosphatase (HAD superfamily)
LTRLAADARTAVAVEDSSSGIASAVAAGLRVLWLSRSDDARSPAPRVECIRSLSEVLEQSIASRR